MKYYKFIFAFLMITLLAVNVSTLAQTDKAKKTTSPHQKEIYTCPMHPDVVSDKAGKCPKCGMSLVKKESEEQANQTTSAASEKVKQAKQLLKEAKDELAKQGKYSCCINNPCNICLLEHQNCNCYTNLKSGKEVCNECYGGWKRGEGVDNNIDSSKVKTSYKKHSH